MAKESCETREIAYAYRYNSGHLIPNSVYNYGRIRD